MVEKDINLTLKQGITAHQGGKFKEAVKFYKEILKHKSTRKLNSNEDLLFITTYLNLSAAFKSLGKLEESIISCRKAIELKPNYAEAHFNLGVILVSLGKLEEAVKSYSKAIEFKIDYVEAYVNLGIALNHLDRLEEAEKNYNKAIMINSNYIGALVLILILILIFLRYKKNKKKNIHDDIYPMW